MGRRRRLNTDLPQNMRLSKGRYYLVQRTLEGRQVWHPLGKDREQAILAYSRVGGLSARKRARLGLRETLHSLEELRALPAITTCGIYFLWSGDDLLYVGRSGAIKRRVAIHRYMKRFEFTHFTAFSAAPSELPQLEFAYAMHYRPPMNRFRPSLSVGGSLRGSSV